MNFIAKLLLVVVALGCGKSKLAEWYGKVHIGMNMEEVRAITGPPTTEESSASNPYVWIFVDESNPKSKLGIGFDEEKRVIQSDYQP